MHIFPSSIILSSLLGAAIHVREFTPARHEGLQQSIEWCRDGLMNALQKSVSTLVAQNISPTSAAELKALYFQDRAALRRLEHDEAAPVVEARRAMQKQASPLDAVMAIMPVVSDILLAAPEDDPTTLSHANKLRAYTDRICRLSDIESQIPSLKDITPYSCALSDLIHSAVVCEAAKLDAGLYRHVDDQTRHLDDQTRHLDGSSPSSDGSTYPSSDGSTYPSSDGSTYPSLDGSTYPSSTYPSLAASLYPSSDGSYPSLGCVEDSLPMLPDDAMCIPAPQTLQSRNDNLKYFHYSDANLQISLNLIDLSGGKLPQYIPEEIRQQEILTYLTLFRANELFSHLSTLQHDHEKCVAQAVAKQTFIPGWTPIAVFNSRQLPPVRSDQDTLTSSTTTSPTPAIDAVLPMGILLQEDSDPCHFAFNVRGSKTIHELSAAFSTAKDSEGVHAGVDEFVQALAPELEKELTDAMKDNECSCDDVKLMFYGHSFGAAITQVLSVKVAKDFDCPLSIDGVFFSPPRIFDRAQRTDFVHRVNSRVIIDVNDGLHYLPCFEGNAQNGSVRCASRPTDNIFHAAAHTSHGRDFVVENFGLILLDVDYRSMSKQGGLPSESYIVRKLRQTYPFLMTVVSALLPPKTLASLPSAMDFYAAHVCAPACALSAACIPLPGIGKPFRWWCESCLNMVAEVGI